MAYIKPIHPGKVLRKEHLDPLGLNANALARAMNVPAQRIHEILHEKRAITPDTALRLGRYLQMAPIYWLQLQIQYDLHKSEIEIGGKVVKEVQARANQSRVANQHKQIIDRKKQLQKIERKCFKVFKTKKRVLDWLESNVPELGGRTPAELIKSDNGINIVLAELKRIQRTIAF